jgi:hypothetical protein
MSRRREVWTGRRAAVAVLALYALVLQSFLGASASAGMSVGAAPLCLHADGSGPPLPGSPVRHPHANCCTAACATGSLARPPLAFVNAAPPARAPGRAAFTAPRTLPRSVSPLHARSARGPPSA